MSLPELRDRGSPRQRISKLVVWLSAHVECSTIIHHYLKGAENLVCEHVKNVLGI